MLMVPGEKMEASREALDRAVVAARGWNSPHV